MVNEAVLGFIGDIEQRPPVFSALKKDGKRLYEYARKGENVQIQPRTIEIFKFEITKIRMPEIEFKVLCSKGTYIRSIANDIGLALNSGGHLAALRRTHIGQYAVDDAFEIEKNGYRTNYQDVNLITSYYSKKLHD